MTGYSGWPVEELEDEFALMRDRGEDTAGIEVEIRCRGGNPYPSPFERQVVYEANQVLRG